MNIYLALIIFAGEARLQRQTPRTPATAKTAKDIRYIKDLLGHFDIRTTERYLHVSKQKLVNIISPLDDLMSKENIDW